MAEFYEHLFSPFRPGSQKLKNCIAMAPLTRQVAKGGGTLTATDRVAGLPMVVGGGIAEGSQAEAEFKNWAVDIVASGRPISAHPCWARIERCG